MTGREIFEKYDSTIRFLIRVTRVVPRRLRVWLLYIYRNRSGKIALLIRYLVISTLAKNVGKNVVISPGVYFRHINNLSIGNNVSIHEMCYIDAEGEIVIGSDVSIAHRTSILSSNHGYRRTDIPIKYQEMEPAKTVINDNVWIGCGCVILAGNEIGTGCVIGANSTITKSVPSNSIAVGSPAKVINKR